MNNRGDSIPALLLVVVLLTALTASAQPPEGGDPSELDNVLKAEENCQYE